MKYVQPINSHLFCVYDNMAGLDFYVYLDDDNRMEEAMKIAEEEISKWVSEVDSYYCNVGYIECIKNAFEGKPGIEADYYGKVE